MLIFQFFSEWFFEKNIRFVDISIFQYLIHPFSGHFTRFLYPSSLEVVSDCLWAFMRKRFFDIHISLGHYLSWSYIVSKLTFVVFVEGNQGRGTFFAADIYLQLIYIWKIMELTLPFWRICYMYVITGGENTSSTVKLKLRGKLHCMQPIQGFGSWLWE